MSELALTLLRLGFLGLLWIGIFAALNLMRRDLRSVERRSVGREPSVKAAFPSRANRIKTVVVTTEDGSTSRHPLVRNLTIGRSQDCSIVLEDDYASSLHATVTQDEQGWLYTDNGSTNGTWQERKRLEAPLRLKVGSTVRIGRTKIRFEK